MTLYFIVKYLHGARRDYHCWHGINPVLMLVALLTLDNG